nr:hypothetical protein [Tanacetum cinerariifolium]
MPPNHVRKLAVDHGGSGGRSNDRIKRGVSGEGKGGMMKLNRNYNELNDIIIFWQCKLWQVVNKHLIVVVVNNIWEERNFRLFTRDHITYIDHTRWLFETNETYGFGNAVWLREGYLRGGEYEAPPWFNKRMNRLLTKEVRIYVALISPYRSNRPPECLNLHVSSISPLPKPTDANNVRSMWLFRHKYLADGTFSRYKARLVANVHQLDVKNAFLYGDLSKTVYMPQPLGFQDSAHPDYVCLQRTATAYLLLNDDDIVLTASFETLLQHIIACLHQKFFMTDLGLLNYFLGIFVTHDSSGIFLSQRKYVAEILERAHMANCNPSWTPVDTESKLGDDGDPVSDLTFYRSLAGSSFHVSSRYQYADIFTKRLPSALFEEFHTILSTRSPPVQTAKECFVLSAAISALNVANDSLLEEDSKAGRLVAFPLSLDPEETCQIKALVIPASREKKDLAKVQNKQMRMRITKKRTLLSLRNSHSINQD